MSGSVGKGKVRHMGLAGSDIIRLAGVLLLLGGAPPQRGFGQGTEVSTTDVGEILARAEARYGRLTSLQASFEQTIENPILERSRTGRGVWYQKGPGRFKMDFDDPQGDVIVADGEHLWLYYPSTHPGQVIRSEIELNATGTGMVDLQGRIFSEAEEKYEATYGGLQQVGGRRTHLVAMRPLGESPYLSVRVWVDARTYLVRRFEITERNETLRTVTLSELKPDQAIADSVFRFKIPPGVDLFAG